MKTFYLQRKKKNIFTAKKTVKKFISNFFFFSEVKNFHWLNLSFNPQRMGVFCKRKGRGGGAIMAPPRFSQLILIRRG